MSRREVVEFGFGSDLEVIRATKSFKSTMEWSIEKGLLPAKKICKYCKSIMKINRNIN